MQRQFAQLQLQRRHSMDDQALPDQQDGGSGGDGATAVDPVRSVYRRASLDVDVERAVAMVNEYPELDQDDCLRSPFGNRRDSLL